MPVPEPVAFTIFGIDIMWYAVLITSGMIIATVICCVRAPKHDLTSDQIINFVIICPATTSVSLLAKAISFLDSIA